MRFTGPPRRTHPVTPAPQCVPKRGHDLVLMGDGGSQFVVGGPED